MLRAFLPLSPMMTTLELWMAPIFDKTPHLPRNVRETLAGIAPWVALIAGVLGLFGLLSAGMMSSMLYLSMWLSGTSQLVYMITMLLGLLASILDLLAFRPLSARKKQGWNYLFYGAVLMAVSAILSLLVGYGSLGSIIGPLIGFWLLFEVRSLYR